MPAGVEPVDAVPLSILDRHSSALPMTPSPAASSHQQLTGRRSVSRSRTPEASGAEAKLDRDVYKPAPIVVEQVTRIYDRETAELLLNKGLAFRSMHAHGRALNGLLPHAVDDVEAYNVREGELISGVVNGWNFGDGHLHHEQLGRALQARCDFAPGDVRVVFLESQPFHRRTQAYRLFDPAVGEIERGYVEVADLVCRQPVCDDVRVHVTRSGA